MNFYLSLENSKKLKEWGCEIKTNKCYGKVGAEYPWMLCTSGRNINGQNLENNNKYKNSITTYHLLEDICVKYAKEFFGEKLLCYDCGAKVGEPLRCGNMQIGTGVCSCNRQYENNEPAFEYHSKFFLYYLQLGEKEEAEDYFMQRTVFNPSNK